ncbi:MAG TPA: sialidase family protein [Acidimicrobiales bacterium]|nr:sialidase family protein [Acidimicrobiales bacterium]
MTSRQAASPAGCDSSRRGISYGPGGTDQRQANVEPCLTYTFPDYGENGIIISEPQTLANGVTTPARVMIGGIYKPNQALPDFGNLATSIDGGATWSRVLFPADSTQLAGNSEGSDPGFYQDPKTHRLFFYRDAANEGPFSTVDGEYHISYSDDGGEDWVNNYTTDFFPEVSDAVVMFAGPPRTATDAAALKAAGYPDVTYLCGHLPESDCFKSLDGGINFTQIKDSSGTDEAGSNDAVVAGPNGTLYGVASGKVTESVDDGATWTPVPAALPTGFSSDCARPSDYGSLFLDRAGNIYVGGTNSNGELAVTYSKDRGATWSKPVQLQMPGTGITMCTFAEDWNRPGHFVASYYAYPPGATVGSVEDYGTTGGPTHGYITVTDDLFDTSPVFTSVQVDPNADPLMPEGGPCTAPFEQCVPHSASRTDYINVNFNPVDGSPWAVFAQDNCSSVPACAEDSAVTAAENGGSTGNSYEYWTSNVGAVATIANS